MITGPPAWMAGRAARRILKLPNLAPPRIASAALHTLFNGWCTAWRFQQKGKPNDRCYLGCVDATDSIEHYCRCSVVRQVLRKKLRIDICPKRALSVFCMCSPEQNLDDILALSMLGVYATYNATNHYRKREPATRGQAAQHIGQTIIKGCQGHNALTTLLENRWKAPIFYIT